MSRVPLPFRGVAVLLLVASTALGQTPEPPAEISLDSFGSSSPDLLRQFSQESHNPLLNLMVDGEFTSVEADPPKDSAKLKPTPQSKSAPAAATESDTDGCPVEIDCPSAPVCLPFCPPPFPPQQQCHCRKCQRKHGHGHHGCGGQGSGCGYGGGYGNPYLNWPSCPAWCFYGAPLVPCNGGCGGGCGHHKHCRRHGHGNCGCGNQGYGCGYGGGYGAGCWGGWNTSCGDGCWNNVGYGGCMPYVAPPPQQCNCCKCQRHHHGCANNNCYGGYGYGCGYGGGWGGWNEGWCGGCMPYVAPPPQQCNCRKCQRHHHGCSNNYGYAGYGCPGWSVNDCNQGCGRHHRSRGHHHSGCQQPSYAGYGYPMMMPCMGGELFCGEGAFGGDF